MQLDRRSFLKLSALTGLGLGVPMLASRGSAGAAFGGPFWVMVNAGGGWDPRFMFDPILPNEQNRYYTEIGSIGNIQFARYGIDLERMNLATDEGLEQHLITNEQFLTRHGQRLTVLNGVDTSTNNHDAGARTIWSGRIPGQYPSLGALIAARYASDQPMPFISGGSYDVTDGLVPLARVDSPDTLLRLAFPNQIDPNNPDTDLYHTDATYKRIRAAQNERLKGIDGAQRLPDLKRSIASFRAARASVDDLKRLVVPDALVDLPGPLGDLERMERQAQLAVAGFKAGMAASATVSMGGFDTHGDHDRDQPQRIVKLLAGVDFLLHEADAAGLGDKLYVVVGSDFARGPLYNSDRDNAGKDHWPITSMLVIGPGVPGNRVIGGTTGAQNARNIDKSGLGPVDSGGVPLTPEVIHRSLRRVAKLDSLAEAYPLTGEDVDLFG